MPIKDSDQPTQSFSLIRLFDGHSKSSQVSNLSSGQKLKLCSDYWNVQTDLNLRCTHMPTCTLCWIGSNKDHSYQVWSKPANR